MTTIARLLARKQRLLERLEEDLGPHEGGEIERLLAEIDTALNLLDEARPSKTAAPYPMSSASGAADLRYVDRRCSATLHAGLTKARLYAMESMGPVFSISPCIGSSPLESNQKCR